MLKLRSGDFEDSTKANLYPDPDYEFYAICDYKTHKKLKKPEWMIKYYLQAAAYIGAVNQTTELKYAVKDGLIISATERTCAIYHLSPREVGFYWVNWLRMLYAYHAGTGFNWNSFVDEATGTYNPHTGQVDTYLPKRVYIKETV